MLFSFFTTPAEQRRKDSKRQRKELLSIKQTIFTWVLLLIWIILVSFAAISTLDPKWLQELARPGIKAESGSYKDYGDNLLRERNYRMAIVQYQYALEIKPDNMGALVNLAITYGQAGNIQRGVKILKDALQKDTGRRGTISYNLGELLEKQGNIVEANQYYEEALNSEVEQDLVCRKLGTLYLDSRQYEKARVAFEKTLAVQNDPAYLYQNMLTRSLTIYQDDTVNLPIIEELLARNISAEDLAPYDVEIIRQIQRNNPEIAKTHNHLGLIYSIQGDITRAIEHFQQSLQIWPGNIDAQRNLQVLQRLQGEE